MNHRQNVYRRSSVDVVGARWYSNQTKVVQYLDIYRLEYRDR
jgi:hypothetical protein